MGKTGWIFLRLFSGLLGLAAMGQPALGEPVQVLTRPIADGSDAALACPEACGRANLAWSGDWRPIEAGGVCACRPPSQPPWYGPGGGPRASGPGTSCSAPSNHQCAGCSVSCADGKQASCQVGDRGIFTGPSDTLCSRNAKCECK